jgi:hypothetical protein
LKNNNSRREKETSIIHRVVQESVIVLVIEKKYISRNISLKEGINGGSWKKYISQNIFIDLIIFDLKPRSSQDGPHHKDSEMIFEHLH